MRKRQTGFTLIELMITVIIAVILMALAIPNYRAFVQRANRTDAKAALLQVANQQEKFFMQNNRYTNDFSAAGLNMNALTEKGYYNLVIGPGATGAIASSFTITATPVIGERQADDGPCANFSVTDQNIRTSGPDGPGVCWK